MEAIRVHAFGDVDALKLEKEVDKPKCGENDVLIRVHATGVNPVETYIRSGMFPSLPSLPYTPGSDAAGEVVEIGSNVKLGTLSVGQRVYTSSTNSGAYAQYTVAPATRVHPLPDKLSYQQGAAMGIPYFTAYRAIILRGGAKPGETLFIHGASGAVGIACCQLGKALGLRVFGTAGTKAGMDLVVENGAEKAFNHREEHYLKEVMKVTNGVDIIVEMLADVNMSNDLSIINKKGRIMVVGSRGKTNLDPAVVMMTECDIRGVITFFTTEEEANEIATAFLKYGNAGQINPIIAKEYSLDQAGQAHHDIMNSTGAAGKLILTMAH